MGRVRGSEADPLGKHKKGGVKSAKDRTAGTHKTGFEGQSIAPWRKTVSIFKQPVTLVHTTSRDAKKATTDGLKRGNSKDNQQKPVQLLWAKSLEKVEAVLPLYVGDKLKEDGECLSATLQLPARFTPACSLLSAHAAAASLCSAIHNPNPTGPICGQKEDSKAIEHNIKAKIDTDQPLVSAVQVTQADVEAQEKRVLDARKRLQEIRKHFF